jgi:hypothetical protein
MRRVGANLSNNQNNKGKTTKTTLLLGILTLKARRMLVLGSDEG